MTRRWKVSMKTSIKCNRISLDLERRMTSSSSPFSSSLCLSCFATSACFFGCISDSKGRNLSLSILMELIWFIVTSALSLILLPLWFHVGTDTLSARTVSRSTFVIFALTIPLAPSLPVENCVVWWEGIVLSPHWIWKECCLWSTVRRSIIIWKVSVNELKKKSSVVMNSGSPSLHLSPSNHAESSVKYICEREVQRWKDTVSIFEKISSILDVLVVIRSIWLVFSLSFSLLISLQIFNNFQGCFVLSCNSRGCGCHFCAFCHKAFDEGGSLFQTLPL